MPSFRGSSWPRDQTCVSSVSRIGRQVLYHWHHLGSPLAPIAADGQQIRVCFLEAMPEVAFLRRPILRLPASFRSLCTESVGWG